MNFEEIKSEVEKVEAYIDERISPYSYEKEFCPYLSVTYNSYHGFSVELNESVLWNEENDSLIYWTESVLGEDVEDEMLLSDFLIRKITTYYSFGSELFKD